MVLHWLGQLNLVDLSAHADSIYCNDVASIRFGLIHLIVDAHLIRLIVHLLVRNLIVDILRSQTVIAAHVAVVASSWRLKRVERCHSSSIVQIEVGSLILETRVRHDSRVLIFLSLGCLHILRILHRS